MPGRHITDNIISAYECLHFMKRSKAKVNSFCALKLNMMKAYDRLEWDYLRAIMLKLGFSHRWVNIVMDHVSSVSYSVLFMGRSWRNLDPVEVSVGEIQSPLTCFCWQQRAFLAS